MKRAGRFLALILASALALPSAPALAAESCAAVFSSVDLSYIARPDTVAAEIAAAKERSRAAMARIHRTSDRVKKKITGRKTPVEYDFVCVGAGPACISAALTLPASQRSRLLVLERSEDVAAVFGAADFFINTPPAQTSLAGSPRPFAEDSRLPYPHSSQLAASLRSSLAESGSDVALSARVNGVEMLDSGRVLVRLAEGGAVVARHVLLGTGLGERSTKINDPEYRRLFEESRLLSNADPRTLAPIMHSDSLLGALRAQADAGLDPAQIARRVPREILVVGGGDGSRIALEGLAALPLDAKTRITWLHRKIDNAAEYARSLEGRSRYEPMISTLFQRGLLRGIEGRADGARRAGDGIVVRGADGTEVNADHPAGLVIDATGYEPINTSLLRGLGGFTREPVRGEADGFRDTLLGHRIQVGERALPIYEIGVSAGMMLSKSEAQTRAGEGRVGNPAAILNNTGRVRALVSGLLTP